MRTAIMLIIFSQPLLRGDLTPFASRYIRPFDLLMLVANRVLTPWFDSISVSMMSRFMLHLHQRANELYSSHSIDDAFTVTDPIFRSQPGSIFPDPNNVSQFGEHVSEPQPVLVVSDSERSEEYELAAVTHRSRACQ